MKITVETLVKAPMTAVWKVYTTPEDIVVWNAASDDWHTTRAELDLEVGGAFSYRMEAKDGSAGFDFAGVYTAVDPGRRLAYRFGDRDAVIAFTETADGVRVSIVFDAETIHSPEQQQEGWQAILDRFARHVEGRH